MFGAPIPPKASKMSRLKFQQAKFWDIINEIELPLIKFVQKYCFAYRSTKFWKKVEKLASPRYTRFIPLILFSTGNTEKAKQISLSLVYFALFSSFGKHLITRRRPGSYPDVHSPDCCSTSSFPSRHTIGATIVYSYFPFSSFWILMVIMSRIMLGMHFFTDCVSAVIIGKLALCISQLIMDSNYSLFLLLVTFRIWSGAYKILSGALPLLIAPSIKCSPIFCPLILLWPFLRRLLPKENKQTSYELFVIETIPISFLVFMLTFLNSKFDWIQPIVTEHFIIPILSKVPFYHGYEVLQNATDL